MRTNVRGEVSTGRDRARDLTVLEQGANACDHRRPIPVILRPTSGADGPPVELMDPPRARVIRSDYQGSPIARARNPFSGSIVFAASVNVSRNRGLVTSLSLKLRVPTKSFRRRSWMNGWFGSYPGGGL